MSVADPLLPDPPGTDGLVEALVAARIAGAVDTPRENNLRNIERLVQRQEGWTFGLTFGRPWDEGSVFRTMVERVGIHPDPAYRFGPDTIDPLLTVARLDAMSERLVRAARDRQRVMVATGHPAGVFAVHAAVAGALARCGATLLRPAEGWSYRTGSGEHREIRYLTSVATVSNRGGLNHTHSARPMQAALEALAAAGEPPPDLVVADHGWAGAAGEAGVDTVGFADCNDPALVIGEADGKVAVCVPLDDNVLPGRYAPIAAYLVRHLE